MCQRPCPWWPPHHRRHEHLILKICKVLTTLVSLMTALAFVLENHTVRFRTKAKWNEVNCLSYALCPLLGLRRKLLIWGKCPQCMFSIQNPESASHKGEVVCKHADKEEIHKCIQRALYVDAQTAQEQAGKAEGISYTSPEGKGKWNNWTNNIQMKGGNWEHLAGQVSLTFKCRCSPKWEDLLFPSLGFISCSYLYESTLIQFVSFLSFFLF